MIPLAVEIGLQALPAVAGFFGGKGKEQQPLDFNQFMRDFMGNRQFGLSQQELGLAREGQRELTSTFDIAAARGLDVLRNSRRGSSAQAASMGLQAASMKAQRSAELTRRIAALSEETRRRSEQEWTTLGIQAFSAVSADRNATRQAEIARQQQQMAMFGETIGSVTDAIGSYKLLDTIKSLGRANAPNGGIDFNTFDTWGSGTPAVDIPG